jgi:molybdate/tungstate transport system substrate-binding protein
MVLATAQPELFNRSSEALANWQDDWYDLLFSQAYTYGISDPDRDPAGYYSHLLWKLAEMHYNRPGLYRRFTLRLDPRWIRPKSSELVALLETGNLDFAFLYKSSAIQNNLAYLTLPPQVSLGEAAYAEAYSRAFVRVGGRTRDSSMEIRGAPIQYGLAVILESNIWAQRFVEFLLSPESEKLYREMGYLTSPIRKISSKEFSDEIDSNLAGAHGGTWQRLSAGDPRSDPLFDAQLAPSVLVGDIP